MYMIHAQNHEGVHVTMAIDNEMRHRIVADLSLQKFTVLSMKKAGSLRKLWITLQRFYVRHSSISLAQQRFFSAEMATLLEAGIPIHMALLKLLLHSVNMKISHVVYQAYQNFLQGFSIEDAFKGYPKIFTPVFMGFLKEAILTGNLRKAFIQFSEYCEYRLRTLRNVSTNIVPLVFSAGLAWVVTFVVQRYVLYVVNEEAELLGKKLSLWGGLFNSISPWILSYKVIIPVVAIPLLFSRLLRSAFVVHIPFLRKRVSLMAKLQFTKVMVIGLKTGMNFQSCFQVAYSVMDNAFYQKSVKKALAILARGGDRSLALKTSGLFSPLHCSLLAHTQTHVGLVQNLEVIIDFLESELRVWDTMTGQAKKYSILGTIVLYLLLTALAVLYGLLGWQ